MWRPLSLFEAAFALNCRRLQSGRRGEAPSCRLLSIFFNRKGAAPPMNKRKRVAIAKHRVKKKKLKARLAAAR